MQRFIERTLLVTTVIFGSVGFAAPTPYLCYHLGDNTPELFTVDGEQLHWDNGTVVSGRKTVSTIAGFTAFSGFKPEQGQYGRSQDTILISDTPTADGNVEIRLTEPHTSIANPDAAEPYRWLIRTSQYGDGKICRVSQSQPLNCPAQVAEATESRAIKDGSSAGSPGVKQKGNTGEYTVDIDDVESGPFDYVVSTQKINGDLCKITKIVKQ